MKILLALHLLQHLILLVFLILAILHVVLSHSYLQLLFCSWLVILNIFSCVYWPFRNPLCVCTCMYNCLLMSTKLVTRYWNDVVPNSSPWQPPYQQKVANCAKRWSLWPSKFHTHAWVLSHFCHVWLLVTPWSPQGYSVHWIFQARILECVTMSSCRGSSWPRDPTCVFCIGRLILYHWATWETSKFHIRASNWQSWIWIQNSISWASSKHSISVFISTPWEYGMRRGMDT